ncbi:MAG: paraquat-inducible protein A [Verrucomicrobiota bacterium]
MSRICVSSRLISCSVCGLTQQRPRLQEGEIATCTRCNEDLEERHDSTIIKAFAFSLGSLCLLLPANIFPILYFNYSGQWKENWIISGFTLLYVQGSPITAFMVLFTSFLAPILLHLLIMVACGSILFKPLHGVSRKIWNFLFEFKEWGMLDIYLVGLGVGAIKLLGMGDVATRPGLFCVFAFVLLSSISLGMLEPKRIWQRLRQQAPQKKEHHAEVKNIIVCNHCGTVLESEGDASNQSCPVCQASLEDHDDKGFKQAWWFLHSATLLYLPGNIFPVMTIILKADRGSYTVMGGIEYLWHHGDIVPAVVVFIASMIVPVAKIITLYTLFFTYKNGQNPLLKTKLFLWVKALGRWSMVDIFVLSILVALGQLGIVATVDPEIGAIPFCGMIVFTMLAANSFKPKAFWQYSEEIKQENQQPESPLPA